MHPMQEMKNRKKYVIYILLAVEIFAIIVSVLGVMKKPQIVVSEGMIDQVFSLQAGVYDLRVEYVTDTSAGVALTLLNNGGTYGELKSNLMMLYKGVDEATTRFWLLDDTDTIYLHLDKLEGANVEIRNIQFIKTNVGSRVLLCIVLLVLLLINAFYLFWERIGRRKLTYAILFTAIILSSMPIFMSGILTGDDITFHILRIEGLLRGWQDGQFPVRIQPGWLSGGGYAVSVFYSDLFLAIPAILNGIGFTTGISYQIYVFLINVATVLVAYKSFRVCTEESYIAAIASFLYVIFPYRLHDIYIRAAVGEYTAMVFLPLLFCGFYLIFTRDIQEKKYKNYWWWLVIGFTGIIHSHILTCEMVALVVIILCIMLIKRVFRLKTFIVLIKSVIITILVNAWYLIPFLDYFLTEEVRISQSESIRIQERGIYPAHFFTWFFDAGRSSDMVEMGMKSSGSYSLGIGLMIILGSFCFLWYVGRLKKEEKEIRQTGIVLVCFVGFLLIMTTSYFSWDRLSKMGDVSSKLIDSLQYPSRFLILAGVGASMLSVFVLGILKRNYGINVFMVYASIVLMLSSFLGLYQLNAQITDFGYMNSNTVGPLGKTNVSEGEYLPSGVSPIGDFSYELDKMSESIFVESYEKGINSLHATLSCENKSEVAGFIDIPLIKYAGYHAIDIKTGVELEQTKGEGGRIRVIIPSGYKGTLKVYFEAPWYWRIGEIITYFTILGIVVYIVLDKRKYKKELEA